MYASTSYQIAKARVADMHHEAQRDALARAARDSQKQQSKRSAPGIPALAARYVLNALGARA